MSAGSYAFAGSASCIHSNATIRGCASKQTQPYLRIKFSIEGGRRYGKNCRIRNNAAKYRHWLSSSTVSLLSMRLPAALI
jgi:hypothetical protein